MKKGRKWSTFVLLFIFFTGLSVMLYPSLSSYWNSKTQTKAIVDYEKMLASIKPEDYTRLFDDAKEYNQKLAELDFPLIEYGKLDGYEELLDVTGTGILGYIKIEKINLELPIYHGTSDEVLSHAVGHLEGSGLPIAGESVHSVLSAHRGLPTATLFTNLDHLEVGDVFTITVLDKEITYQVDQIKTVTPSDSTDLIIKSGENMCTLLTCTPYGINSHRLLVRGSKIDSASQRSLYIISDAYQIEPMIVTPIVALPIIMTLMIVVLFKPVKKDNLGDEFE